MFSIHNLSIVAIKLVLLNLDFQVYFEETQIKYYKEHSIKSTDVSICLLKSLSILFQQFQSYFVGIMLPEDKDSEAEPPEAGGFCCLLNKLIFKHYFRAL